jgi:hypothetical protein
MSSGKAENDMTSVEASDFGQEKKCIHKGEHYCVRDNGAVLRHSRKGKRARNIDNQWSYGKENSANFYFLIAGVRVHRIVATAFHGEPPDPVYVVDHIDSNFRNNRPNNLRWLTRLENSLKNPATRKKIEYLCGSIEAFLENPSMLNRLQGNPSIAWMRTVTREEAQNCKARMSVWATSNKKTARSPNTSNRKSSFGEIVLKPFQKWEVNLDREPGLDLALTPWCAQYMWRASAYFPCCPHDFGADPLYEYFQHIRAGAVLAYSNSDDLCPKLTVLEAELLLKKSSILVMNKRADCNWTIVGIELHQKSRHFIHFILGSYSNKVEADKQFNEKRTANFWSDGYVNNYNH